MFAVLVVLYQKSVKDAASLQGILKSADILNKNEATLFLWDNSPTRILPDDEEILRKAIKQIIYIHTPENLYLSKVYNQIIDRVKEIKECKYLILLDDDSNIDQHFFQSFLDVSGFSANLYIPVVTNSGVIRSPQKYYIIKAYGFKQLAAGVLKSSHIMAINSGMIISCELLRKSGFKYDERLKNYGTDNFFMKFYSQYAKELFVLDYHLNHSLSFFDSDNVTRQLKVFKQIKEANIIVHSDSFFENLLAKMFNILSSIKYAVIFRNPDFLK